MGFLEEGTPLAWRESDRYRATVKRRGVREFLKLFRHFKDNQYDRSSLFWGDELEFCLVRMDYSAQMPRLFLAAEGVLDELRSREALLCQALSWKSPLTWRCVFKSMDQSMVYKLTSLADSGAGLPYTLSPFDALLASSAAFSNNRDGEAETGNLSEAPAWQLSGWHPEYGRHMVEAIPGRAFPLDLDSLFYLLPSMQIRRKKIQAVLPPGCHVVSLTSFPTMGALVSDFAKCDFEKEQSGDSSDATSRVDGSQANPRAANCGVRTLAPGDFASPPIVPDPFHGSSMSIFVGDEVIQKHPRFRTLTANIRERRGRKVDITVPLFQDACTFPRAEGGNGSGAFAGDTDQMKMSPEHRRRLMMEGKILHDGRSIYMDHMGFGMGMHCTQATFGCPSLSDARYLYDQLGVLAPLWLSLTAATPFLRGLVAGTDTRWATLAGSVDCRTENEFQTLPKSRYGSFSLYIGDHDLLRDNVDFYNDIPAPVEPRAYAALIQGGVDPILARHVAFLFVRDPLVIFRDKLVECKGEKEEEAVRRLEAEAQVDWGSDIYDSRHQTTADFENLQSTNWNSVRFKPPPSFKKFVQQALGHKHNSSGSNEGGPQSQLRKTDKRELRLEGEESPGATVQTSGNSRPSGNSIECWRVEFRTPETQLTDFENAASIALITVLVQVLLEDRFELYIPMSLNEENMRRSSQINSIMTQKFWFRKDIRSTSSDRSVGEFYLHEILFGVPVAPGRQPPAVALVPACLDYMERKLPGGSPFAAAQLLEFFEFIRHRSQGILPTNASFFRAYLAAHPDYKRDSVVSQTISFGVCDLGVKIGQGAFRVHELFGPFAHRVGMRISDDGNIQTYKCVSKPIVTPDFPCPLGSRLASVREQYCDTGPATEQSQAFVRSMNEKTPDNFLGKNGEGSCALSVEEDCPCPDGRTRMKDSLCLESGLRFYLGGCVPLTLQKAWKSNQLQRLFCFKYGETTVEMEERDSGIQKDVKGSVQCEFPGSCLRPIVTTNDDPSWAWKLSAAVGGRDTDTGASDENGSTSRPSLGEICDIPDEAKQETRYNGTTEQEGACSRA